jgi:hypothetical protein
MLLGLHSVLGHDVAFLGPARGRNPRAAPLPITYAGGVD